MKNIFLLFSLLILPYLLGILLTQIGFDYSENYGVAYQYIYLFLTTIYAPFIFIHPIKINKNILFLFIFSLFSVFYGFSYHSGNHFYFILSTLLFPFIFHIYCNSIDKPIIVLNYFLIYIIIKSLIYLILIPFELVFSNKTTLIYLQMSGAQYHQIGLLMLSLYLYNTFSEYFNLKLLRVLEILYIIFSVISFSRIAILLLFAYFFIKVFSRKYYLSFVFYLTLFFIFILIYILNDFLFNSIFVFYLTKFNLFNNFSGFEVSNDMLGFQDDVRYRIFNYITERPLPEIFFGSGIGTSQAYIQFQSFNELAYGSFHNIFLTSFFERGFMFILYFLLVVSVSVYNNILLNRSSVVYLLIFIIFSLTTGVELFVNSRDFNIDITLILVISPIFYKLNNKPSYY